VSADTTPEEKPLRLFIAISTPEPIKSEISKVQQFLRETLAGSRISWSNPEQIHLTLRFLGKVAAAHLPDLVLATRLSAEKFASLNLCAVGIGCFPNLRRPRVIWVGEQDESKQLLDLQKQIQTATQPFTSEPADDRFHPHLTLGRVKEMRAGDAKALEKQATILQQKVFGSWQAHEIEIMRSELSPKGARHTCLAAIPLKSKPDFT